ncbi:uncharacterized protein LOC117915394 [Vitis riparia]|uniref:uncharacterized protein LOC117915394 n=1 Tax=Vitis riparia TaxID=96939 RepID=UPI00155AFA96|nr:uncharacterized protein LOC117915394 [Vitis riparia]
MKEVQASEKEHKRSSVLANRRSKSISDQAKEPQKITKKSLNAAFADVSEDVSQESTGDSIDFSRISEVFDGNRHRESIESVKVLNPALSTSSETSALFDIAPSSKISTKKNELENVLVESYGMAGSDGLKIESLEAEIVVELLTQARAQVLNSSDTDIRSKRLLDTLIKIIIDETYLLPGQTDQFPGVVFARTRLLMVCFLLWILTISVVSFIRSGAQGSIYEPPPT